MLPRRTRHFVTQVPCPPTIAPVRPSLSVAPDKHHSFALIGNQEYDPVILERSATSIARALAYQALERSQRQEEVEARSGFSQQYLSSLERGRRNPTVITLYELAQALRVSHVELVEPDDDKT